MTYDVVRYDRGQLWMIRSKNPNNTAYGHEQNKDRPWLILSVGKFNKSSGMITAVPVTTRDEILCPSHVKFCNERGQNNVILCEQIRAFDYTSGAYLFEYMGNVSGEILEKVDVAISIHLGLHYSPITLKRLHDSMEAIVKSIAYTDRKNNTPKFTDEDVLQFAEKLELLATQTTTDEISATSEDTTVCGLCSEGDPRMRAVGSYSDSDAEFNPPADEEEKIPTTPVTVEDTPAKSTRVNWTPKNCRDFLNDCDTMPMKQVMEKWNICKKSRFYVTRNYVRGKLTEMTE